MKIGSLKKFSENSKHPINSKAVVFNGDLYLTDGVQVINFHYSSLFKKACTIYACSLFDQKPGDDIRKLAVALKETKIPQGLYLFNNLFKHPYTQSLCFDLQPVLDFLQISINMCDEEYNFRKFYLVLFDKKGLHLELHDKIPYAVTPKYGDTLEKKLDIFQDFYLDPVRVVQILNFYHKEFGVTRFKLVYGKEGDPVYFYFPENRQLKALLMPILKYKKAPPKKKKLKQESIG